LVLSQVECCLLLTQRSAACAVDDTLARTPSDIAVAIRHDSKHVRVSPEADE